jgi:hypothetical protein
MFTRMLRLAALLLALSAAGFAPPAGAAPHAAERQPGAAATYRFRLVATNVGTVVEQREYTASARSDAEFVQIVANTQLVFGQELNRRNLRWTNISYQLLSKE